MKKQIMTLIAAAALGVSLAGCGQGTDSTADNTANAASSYAASSVSAGNEASSADSISSTNPTSSPDTENRTGSTGSAASEASAASSDPAGSENTETAANTSSDEVQAGSDQNADAGDSSLDLNIPSADDIEIKDTITDSQDGGHAILADGTQASYSNTAVEKTGEADGDEADFYGSNAAVFAANGGTLDLSDMVITTNGTHANAVFSYGEGTTVNISNSVIDTSGNCSGGLMTTGGGTMNASNLNIHTTGNSSAAIRSDRGGGTVNVTGGSYTTDGKGSPAIYSTADITVSDAALTSTASQGIVIEGKNSVTLNNVYLNADNNTKNSDKSSYYQAVMIYQSMSGDASVGKSSFTMNGGTLTNANGDIFFINNTATDITLKDAVITNNGDGVFLRAAAAGWGKEGSNGGKVNLYADEQAIDGDMVVDEISILNLYLDNGSVFTGAVNSDGQSGEVYVELKSGSVWKLTQDSYITSLTCEADSIDLNGHTLYVNGKAYEEGTAASGEAVEIAAETAGEGGRNGEGGPGGSDSGRPAAPPDGGGNGGPGSSGSDSGRPAAPPDGGGNGGNNGNGGTSA